MPASRPNVLVFFTDQQRWDTTGLGGNPMGLTPHFDRLARAGTYLAQCFTCQPVCLPARASLQTGRYASQVGCHTNGHPLPPGTPTLADYFRGAGYTTGYIGKWHLAGQEPVPEELRGGYEYWLAANSLEFTSEPYRTLMYDNDNRPVELPGYRVDAQADAMIRYISERSRGNQPWFLFSSFLEPHFQNHLDDYPPPDGYRELYTKDYWVPPDLAALGGTTHQHLPGYYGMVKRLDEALGRVCDALKSLGQLERTILLFTADHGCHFKTRNGEYKRSCHDASLRVPTFLHGPRFVAGGEVPELVSLVDLPATLLDAAGIAVPAAMSGRSILPLLGSRGRGEAVPWPQEVFAQISEAHVGRCVRTRRWKYEVGAESTDWLAGAAPVYREAFLYDLACDPYELRNLIEEQSHAAVCARMKQRLLARMAAADEALPEIVEAKRHPSGQRRVSAAEVEE